MKLKVAYNPRQRRTKSTHAIHQHEYKSKRGRFPLPPKVDRERKYA